jgi:hypothetical protein
LKKAFSLALFVIGLIALATLLVFHSPSERGGDDLALDSQVVHEIKPETQKQKKALVPEQRKSLSKKFLDAQLPLPERLDAWLELNRDTRLSPETLTEIALSPNPYRNEKKEPHTVSEMNFRREEGFRIMALQGLEKAALKDPALMKFIEQVSSQAASPTVRKIAGKMKEFVTQGKSYSHLFEQAVLNQEIPQ